MDETFPCRGYSAVAYMALQGAASVTSTSHLHEHDLNDARLQLALSFPFGACDSIRVRNQFGLLIRYVPTINKSE